MGIFIDLLSIVLLALTPLSYISQYYHIIRQRSSVGYSIPATIMTALMAQTQIANMYFLVKMAPFDQDVPIATPISRQNWLTLAQLVVQWLFSLIQFGLVVYFPASSIQLPDSDIPAGRRRNGPSRSIKAGTAGLIIQALLLHIASTCAAGSHGNPRNAFNAIFWTNLNIAMPFFTAMAVVASACQTYTTTHSPTLGSLSLRSLSMQSVTFLALAALWPFRLLISESMWQAQHGLWRWYTWVGWTCVNNAVFGLGQVGVLFAASGMKESEDGPVDGENQPLLQV